MSNLNDKRFKSLRRRTDEALRKKAEEKQTQIESQVTDFFATMGPIADKGLCEGDYRKDLCEEARQFIESQGIKLKDLSDGFASYWEASW